MAGCEYKEPKSCDTFVALPPATANGFVIFGKNSDRPGGEVQEVVYVPPQDYSSGEKVKCTYIEIDQVSHTHAVILSKPSWMWGAEMGSNEYGVCIGNEAVWTKLNGPEDSEEKLLGMDLLRLGLERSTTAKEALDVICTLLADHGQGGPCSDSDTDFTYHNSFLIADRSEAWILETAGNLWAAEQITSGVRNISNGLTITTKIDAMSPNLKEVAQEKGYWDPSKGDFNFATAFSDNGDNSRYKCGKNLLQKFSASSKFGFTDMFTILRDARSGICMGSSTTGSQVSVLTPAGSDRPCCHWFTGTPDPRHSVFKPFVFGDGVRISPHIQSPVIPDNEDPAKVKPRFQKTVDRRHLLYKLHQQMCQKAAKDDKLGRERLKTLQGLESKCVQEMEVFLNEYTPANSSEAADIFKDVVESEMKFYK